MSKHLTREHARNTALDVILLCFLQSRHIDILAVKHSDGHTSVVFCSGVLMAPVTNGAILSQPQQQRPALLRPGDKVWSFTQRGETFPAPLPALESRRLLAVTPHHTQSQNSLWSSYTDAVQWVLYCVKKDLSPCIFPSLDLRAYRATCTLPVCL